MASPALAATMPARSPASSSSSGRKSATACRPVAAPVRRRRASRPVPPARAMELLQLADLDIDWSDTDTQIGALGALLGLGLGIGAPMFYASRDERDEARLEELRALNRATKEETGEYLTQDEINAIRPARWTDRREFVDDD